MRYELKDLQPEEIVRSVEAALRELKKIKDYMKVMDKRNAEIREHLIATLTKLGLEDKDFLVAGEQGVLVKLQSNTRHRLVRETLEQLGVASKILDDATVTTTSQLIAYIHDFDPDNESEYDTKIGVLEANGGQNGGQITTSQDELLW